MTKHIVVAIYDQQLDSFGRPFYTPTPGAAVRTFQDEVNRPADDNPLHKHPEDFALHQLAVFDDTTGKFTNSEHTTQLATAKMMKTGA